MKTCKYEGCGYEIDDKYEFCYRHFRTNTSPSASVTPVKVAAWNADPTIDALQKINSNIGNLVRVLERIEKKLPDKNKYEEEYVA